MRRKQIAPFSQTRTTTQPPILWAPVTLLYLHLLVVTITTFDHVPGSGQTVSPTALPTGSRRELRGRTCRAAGGGRRRRLPIDLPLSGSGVDFAGGSRG